MEEKRKSLKIEFDEDLYNISPCGFLSTDANGTIVELNDTFLEMTGYKRNELLYERSLQDLLTIGGKLYYETHYFPLLKMHGSVKEISFEILKKDGSRLPVLVNSKQTGRQQGGRVFIHTSVLDITQRKQYERELLLARRNAEDLVKKLSAANTELQQFASVTSHDLQTPLTAISGYVQFLLETGAPAGEESTRILSRVLEITERMEFLVKDILDFSRLGNEGVAFEEVDLNEVWGYVLKTLHESISKTNAHIAAAELPMVNGNKTQLIRLFQNLLSNALKYKGEREPRIKLTCSREKERWVFSLEDNGIGFKQGQASEVFHFFHRLKPKGRYSGSGIGLAVCKRIVEIHKGEIWATSEPGKGSKFSFTIGA